MANDINGSLDELQRMIEDHWKELLKEAALKVREKLEHLSGQEKSVSISCAVVQSMIEYTEQFVEHSSSDEIVCIHAEIKSYIKKVIKEHRLRREGMMPPLCSVELSYRCAFVVEHLNCCHRVGNEKISSQWKKRT